MESVRLESTDRKIFNRRVRMSSRNLGNALIKSKELNWKQRLENLKEISWKRSNIEVWEGRALINGRLSKASRSVILSSNAIKLALGLKLSTEELRLEKEMDFSNE